MPFYEYKATEESRSCSYCKSGFEYTQSIREAYLSTCPECGCNIEKLVSLPAAVVIKNREANQYAEVKSAKYWRDKNGVRHKVTAADGHSGSATVTKQTASPELVEKRKKHYKEMDKQKRLQLQDRLAKTKANELKKKK